jgi:hypothetical protein
MASCVLEHLKKVAHIANYSSRDFESSVKFEQNDNLSHLVLWAKYYLTFLIAMI